jgi:hypothetical protein
MMELDNCGELPAFQLADEQGERASEDLIQISTGNSVSEEILRQP